jgi:vesicle-fusing ATPase
VPIGPRFSSSVLAAIKGLMKNKPPSGRPLLIFGTTSEKTVLQQLQLDFQAQIAVPNVNTQEQLAKIMQDSGIFSDGEIQGAIRRIEETTGGREIGVGVQRVLLSIQTAMQDEDRAGRFAEVMADAIAEG